MSSQDANAQSTGASNSNDSPAIFPPSADSSSSTSSQSPAQETPSDGPSSAPTTTTSPPFTLTNSNGVATSTPTSINDITPDEWAQYATPNNTGCLFNGAIPIPLQNASSWNQTGCSQGFYCPRNNASALPEFCPPAPQCEEYRLSGGTCPTPMGILEPIICQAGYYCPNGGTQQIICPKGHFCPEGSFEATPCYLGASCQGGTKKNMGFTPLGFLIIVDIILISATVFFKIRQRFKRRSVAQADRVRFPRTPTMKMPMVRSSEYQQLNDDSEYHGIEEGDVTMESRITTFGPSGFEQLGEMGPEFSVREHIRHAETMPTETTDLHRFVQSLSKCLGATKFGLSFEFEDLQFKPPKASKPILSQVSGKINAGSLWGVMGASGAGKSTFVNVLMGKKAHTGGVTKVNGVPGSIKKYKKIIGYVPQDDIVLPELTVRENILHSARIRLPAKWSDKEIQNHVDILISCLQLSHVNDSLVGSPGAPVISGGQRKRVSIGMELAAAPMALFLDEPTSGLDATAAASIMSTLKALTRLGMTIVVIIHQPRQEIFESLDNLVLLGAGRMVYQGPGKEMQPHFERLGFHFPEHNNPADTMGDIIAGEGKLYKKSGDASIQPLIDYWQTTHNETERFTESKSRHASVIEISALTTTIKSRGAYWYKQIWFCFLRSLVQQYRLKSSFFFELGVGALAGFLIGLAEVNQNGKNFRGIFLPPYELLSSSIDYSSVPQMALLVGLAIGLTASAPGVKIFGEEKLVYWREAAAGHNRFAYYIGKVLSTLPRMILACFHFTTMFLLLSTPRISYSSSFAANSLYFYCIYGLASIISMITRREDGPLLAVMLSLIVGVLNGMSPSLHKTRQWHMVWLWRASPGTWLAEAYFDQNVTPLAYLYQIDLVTEALGYKLGQFRLDMCMLLMIGTVYRVVAFLGLRFMWRNKQR